MFLGLSDPVLHLNKINISEGEVVTATCTAPGETGNMYFKFYEDSKEIMEKSVHSNQAVVQLHVSAVGRHNIHCAYIVLVTPDTFSSKNSNTATLSVSGTRILKLFFL